MMKHDRSGMSVFGVWLKTVLDDCGMKQKDLAKIMNTSQACVSRWVHGNRIPASKQLMWMLNYFGYHIEIVPDGFVRDCQGLVKAGRDVFEQECR